MSDDPQSILRSHHAIRKFVGVAAIALPLSMGVYGWLGDAMQPSISHFYWTGMGTIFTGLLIAVAAFLITFQGYAEPPGFTWIGDRTTSILAATGAVGVALFPANPWPGRSLCSAAPDTLGVAAGREGVADVDAILAQALSQSGTTRCPEITERTITDGMVATPRFLADPDLVTGFYGNLNALHTASAVLFFLCIAYFCLVLFPLGPRSDPGRWGERLVYILCGASIVLATLVLLVLFLFGGVGWIGALIVSHNAIFVAEAAALIPFAIAWFVNGDPLKDKPGFRRTVAPEDKPAWPAGTLWGRWRG